ncbi:MAG TPA: haloacid dehalogenase-like hydrolase, partial [Terriglobales bacterium]|nr:haloacid dehalogenase-like hydrolase [Terriglobales bacterium]
NVIAGCVFPEMLELALRLKANGCEIWAVSSTNEWVIREGVRQYGIPPERVLAASVICNNEIATSQLLRVPSGPGKARAIREVIGREVDAVFGNSMHDLAMLELAQNPFVINPNPDLQSIAAERGWPIYWPQSLARTADKASIAK